MAYIIVVGNEKGGSGKSTTSMHIATALARMGHRVGALDLDLRQRSFGRYVENRESFCRREGLHLPMPIYLPLPEIDPAGVPDGQNVYDLRLDAAISELDPKVDYLLIDCPGSHTRLSQLAHSMADTLVTPLNDSFIDFDLLARMDSGTGAILGPSIYAEMVWNARQLRHPIHQGRALLEVREIHHLVSNVHHHRGQWASKPATGARCHRASRTLIVGGCGRRRRAVTGLRGNT